MTSNRAPKPAALPPSPSASRPTVAVYPAPYVLLEIAAAATGYTVKAMRRKIQEGVWREGAEWVRAPDGHVMISMEGYRRWVESAAGLRSGNRTRPTRTEP